MSTISKSIFNQTSGLKRENFFHYLLNRYMTYAEQQQTQYLFWYMKVIVVIPCVYMVLSIFAMATLTVNYIWFVGLGMLLFFANVVAHIAGTKSTFYVPLYHFTTALFILIPIITYILFL